MATIQEIIERVDERKPNAFSQKAKIAWIAELDGKIAADVMLMNINDVRQFNYAYPENLSSEPLIEFPHDSIYDLWLGAKIDFENGEYTKYQNSMEQYNAHYNNFVHWFASTYEPAQGYDCSANNNPPYYITAYALAVKSGFNGTLNEWLESLQGDKVELRYLEDKIQWRWIPNTGAVEGTSDVENVGIENDFQWHDLINVAAIRGEIINHTLQTAIGAAQSAKTSEENAKRYAESIKPPVYLVTFSDTNDANSKWCEQEYSSIMTAHLAGLSVKCQYENYTLPLVQIGNAECIFGATVGTSYRCIVVHSDRVSIVSTRSTVPVYLVTINDSGKAEQSYADRMAAYQSGYVIQCDYLGIRLPLKAVVDMDFMFSGIIDRTSYHVVVRSNGSTAINERSLASQTDIPKKVSDLEDAGDYLTEAPVTSVNGLNGDVSTATKVSLTEQTDGSYLSDLSSAEIMAAYRDHKTVHCYHNKMLLPLIRSVVNDAVFSGIYDGQIHTVNVASNRVATVTVIPLSSGGGSDGITPHIGANGNWWIGEEDTGVSAGATDEQISSAVEEYLEENPLVKTVNGKEPDENGNVELEIPSGGSSGGGAFRIKMVLTEDVSNVVLKMPVKWGKIVQFNLNCIPKLSGESKVEMYNGGMNYKIIGTLSSNTKAFDIYGVHYYTAQPSVPFFSGSIAVADNAEDTARPTLSGHQVAAHPDFDEISIYTTVSGVVFQAGTRLEMWGVYTP
jgi:hypothetical protein